MPLDADFMAEFGPDKLQGTFVGIPLQELSREELMAVIAWYAKELQGRDHRAAQSLEWERNRRLRR